MLDQIWGHMPEEVVYLILAKLPLRNPFRNRVIHRSWNEMMKCPQRNLCCVTDYNFTHCSKYTRLIFANYDFRRPRALESSAHYYMVAKLASSFKFLA